MGVSMARKPVKRYSMRFRQRGVERMELEGNISQLPENWD
jgi:hypothetical protein